MTSVLQPMPAAFRLRAVEALRAQLEAMGLHGALFLKPSNILYFSGWSFWVYERPVGLYVPLHGRQTLFVPDLERENAEEAGNLTIKVYDEFPGEVPPVLWMVAESGGKALAIDMLDASLLDAVRATVDTVVLTDLAMPLRAIKTVEELALTREAARFADLCLERLLAEAGAIIRAGGTERDLLDDCVGHARAALLDRHGKAFAGTKLGITASVHSGPRAALPHGATSSRKPLAGEPLIAGVGASLGGYHAESGVTLVVDAMSSEHRRVMTAMQACNDAAVAALRPGAACWQVNATALAALREAGLGDAIRHRIGHGMGVEGHEAPWLAPGDDTPVAPGMVFSNEPGVYRPGRDGYRTINTMIVTETGVEIPSRFQADHPIETRVVALT